MARKFQDIIERTRENNTHKREVKPLFYSKDISKFENELSDNLRICTREF